MHPSSTLGADARGGGLRGGCLIVSRFWWVVEIDGGYLLTRNSNEMAAFDLRLAAAERQ